MHIDEIVDVGASIEDDGERDARVERDAVRSSDRGCRVSHVETEGRTDAPYEALMKNEQI